jgi:pyruvate dehydrogenase E1 component
MPGPIVAATDYVKALPASVCRWLPREVTLLGTDGFGRSDGREALREFFEVDARNVTLAALSALCRSGQIGTDTVKQAMKEMKVDPDKKEPSAM